MDQMFDKPPSAKKDTIPAQVNPNSAIRIFNEITRGRAQRNQSLSGKNFLEMAMGLNTDEQAKLGPAMMLELVKSGKVLEKSTFSTIASAYDQMLNERRKAKEADESIDHPVNISSKASEISLMHPPQETSSIPVTKDLPGEARVIRQSLAELQRQQELINQALLHGRSAIYTRSTEGEHIAGNTGYQTVLEMNHIGRRSDYLRGYGDLATFLYEPTHGWEANGLISDNLGKLGIHEVFGILPPKQRDVIQNLTVQKKGFLGIGSKTETITQKVGERIETMNDYLQNGDASPACRVYYGVETYGDKTIDTLDQYRHMGRPGQTLTVEFILPIHLVQQLSTEVQNDPTLARKLTDAFINNKYTPTFKKAWADEGRPPYDKWDKNARPKMYFINLITNPNMQPGIDQKNVITYSPTS